MISGRSHCALIDGPTLAHTAGAELGGDAIGAGLGMKSVMHPHPFLNLLVRGSIVRRKPLPHRA